MAAEQLKKKGWKFNNNYFAWFKALEIKSATNESETGTYMFFDYEKDWC